MYIQSENYGVHIWRLNAILINQIFVRLQSIIWIMVGSQLIMQWSTDMESLIERISCDFSFKKMEFKLRKENEKQNKTPKQKQKQKTGKLGDVYQSFYLWAWTWDFIKQALWINLDLLLQCTTRNKVGFSGLNNALLTWKKMKFIWFIL